MTLALLSTSCSTPNKTSVNVRNNADNTATTIKITNGDGGSSSITISPKLSVGVDTLGLNISR